QAVGQVLARFTPHVGWAAAVAPVAWSSMLDAFMAFALPVAASAVGGVIERCSGRNATWLLPPDSPAAAWTAFFTELAVSGMELPSIGP
ncbi:hypothetical protein ABTL60_19510, partial [Acinetobacter baumannii]